MPVPPITATTLYLRNSTTVDTGGAIDIRALDDAHAGANDTSQTATATHTQDNVNRTFDPATAGVTAANDPLTLQRLGWALPLADFTPSDTRCKGFLPAGNATITVRLAVAWDFAIVSNLGVFTKMSLWHYDPATDAGTLIASNTSALTGWTAATENGVQKEIATTLTWASNIVFERGETLLLQVGINTGALPNPTVGTVTYTFTLYIDNSTATRMVFNTTSLRNRCTESGDSTGVGTSDRSIRVRPSEDASAVGETSKSLITVKAARDVDGVGTPAHTLRVTKQEQTTAGVGVAAQTLRARLSESTDGVAVTDDAMRVRASRSVDGVGVPSFTRSWVVFRTASVDGVGEPNFLKTVLTSRVFDVFAVGVLSSRVCLDVEDLPGSAVRRIYLIGEG